MDRQRSQSGSSVCDILVQQNRNKYYDWTEVDSRKKRYRQFKGVTGTMKNCSFKGAMRILDVFLGRVDADVTCNGIKDHIKDVFGIEVIDIKQFVIRSKEFNPFKITVNAGDMNKLFQGRCVLKGYNRQILW